MVSRNSMHINNKDNSNDDINKVNPNSKGNLDFIEAGNPDGKPVILIHGWGADHRYFEFQIEGLKDFRLILPDLEGLGSSPEPESGKYSIQDQAAKVYGLGCSLGIENAIVIGHSMGGMVAQELALTYPEFVTGLVLANTSPGLRHFSFTRFLMLFPRSICITPKKMKEIVALHWILIPESREGAAGGLVAEYARMACGKKLVKYVGAMKHWSSMERLEEIRIPTLIIHGESDRLISGSHVNTLNEMIPLSKLLTIKNSAHVPHLENPEEFNAAVMNFMRRFA